MKLDRNMPGNEDGRGKYALINLRRFGRLCDEAPEPFPEHLSKACAALDVLAELGVLEWGEVGGPDEFFLIKLKDRYAHAALRAYASEAARDDAEWSDEVYELAGRSGHYHPLCKRPD